MTVHYWGDGFDFELLHDAICSIARKCNDQGIFLSVKEKYGTIRYEMLYRVEVSDFGPFLDIVVETTFEFPEIAAEIVDDLTYQINEDSIYKNYVEYFKEIVGES